MDTTPRRRPGHGRRAAAGVRVDEEGCAPTRRVVPVESVLAVVTVVLVRLVVHGVEFPGAGVESVLGEGAEVVAEGSAVVVPVVESAFLQEGVDVVEESLEGDLHRAWEAGVERARGRSWLVGLVLLWIELDRRGDSAIYAIYARRSWRGPFSCSRCSSAISAPQRASLLMM